jgi:hypothetical protein
MLYQADYEQKYVDLCGSAEALLDPLKRLEELYILMLSNTAKSKEIEEIALLKTYVDKYTTGQNNAHN